MQTFGISSSLTWVCCCCGDEISLNPPERIDRQPGSETIKKLDLFPDELTTVKEKTMFDPLNQALVLVSMLNGKSKEFVEYLGGLLGINPGWLHNHFCEMDQRTSIVIIEMLQEQVKKNLAREVELTKENKPESVKDEIPSQERRLS